MRNGFTEGFGYFWGTTKKFEEKKTPIGSPSTRTKLVSHGEQAALNLHLLNPYDFRNLFNF